MDKKGFTTIELIVSFVMVVIMLSSLVGFTIAYRDNVKTEELKSELIDFKNTITKTVYDDIIDLNFISMSPCVGQDNCVVMMDENGLSHILKIENSCSNISCDSTPCTISDCGVYLVYNETKYLLPDSDLNTYYKESTEDDIRVSKSFSNLFDFNLKSENSIYNLKITFKHFELDNAIEIMLTIN